MARAICILSELSAKLSPSSENSARSRKASAPVFLLSRYTSSYFTPFFLHISRIRFFVLYVLSNIPFSIPSSYSRGSSSAIYTSLAFTAAESRISNSAAVNPEKPSRYSVLSHQKSFLRTLSAIKPSSSYASNSSSESSFSYAAYISASSESFFPLMPSISFAAEASARGDTPYALSSSIARSNSGRRSGRDALLDSTESSPHTARTAECSISMRLPPPTATAHTPPFSLFTRAARRRKLVTSLYAETVFPQTLHKSLSIE